MILGIFSVSSQSRSFEFFGVKVKKEKNNLMVWNAAQDGAKQLTLLFVK